MARRISDATPATIALTRAGVAFTEHAYGHDPATRSYGQEAAEAIGVPAARVFKTLVVDVDRRFAVAVLPVDRRLDLEAVADCLGGTRAALADPVEAERSTGYVVGGISPFGQRRPLPTVLDASATAHETILVSGGRRGFDLELAPEDLVRLLDARAGDISRA